MTKYIKQNQITLSGMCFDPILEFSKTSAHPEKISPERKIQKRVWSCIVETKSYVLCLHNLLLEMSCVKKKSCNII